MAVMSPSLNYSAPELVHGVKCDSYADIFSIGMLAFALFNDYRPLFDNKDLLDAFKTNLDKVCSSYIWSLKIRIVFSVKSFVLKSAYKNSIRITRRC